MWLPSLWHASASGGLEMIRNDGLELKHARQKPSPSCDARCTVAGAPKPEVPLRATATESGV